MCTPAKEENKYIKEFIEHYKNYGVDKIFLYDNNDIDGEKFDDILNQYIKSKFLVVVNFRGKKKAALDMMHDCYQKNYRYYDWLIFYEVDEYLYLKDIKNIKIFLNNVKFSKCQKIQLNWIFHTDNNKLYYEDKPLKERFPEREEKARNRDFGGSLQVKSILRGHIPNITINCIHTLNRKLYTCNGFGEKQKPFGIRTRKSDFKYYYIDHYYCKSTEEFINKVNKGDILYYKKNILHRINNYFKMNKMTNEKIKMFEKGIGLNLSILRKN